MKRAILALTLGLVAALTTQTTSHAQGEIWLDNYNSSGPLVGWRGTPVWGPEWTVGFYWDLGDVTSSVAADPSGYADPSSLGPLCLATGPGSTAPVMSMPILPGYFQATEIFHAPDAPPGSTATIMLTVYNGVDYLSSDIRGHSSAFTIILGDSGVGGNVGTAWLDSGAPAGAVGMDMLPIPEPGTSALTGFLGVTLLTLRRRQQMR